MKRKRWIASALVLVVVSAGMATRTALADSALITYWKFDEPTAGSTIADSSVSGFDGTPHGVNGGSNDTSYLPQPAVDVPQTNFPDTHSLHFQGDGGSATGSYIDVSNWNIDTSNGFTVSLWAKPTTTPGSSWERFFDFGNGPGSDNIVFAQYGGSDSVYFEVYNGGSTTKIIAPSGSWMAGSWHLYTATIDAAGNANIYIDGVSVVSGTTNKPINITRTNKYIGKSNWGDDYYEGYMDDFRFYGRALTPTEVTGMSDGDPGPGVPVDDNGLATGVEDASPNGGDANGDGTADSQQANVASFVDAQTNQYVSVAVPSACTLSALSTASDSSQAVADAGYTYPAGLANYTASCGVNGYTATVDLYYYGVSPSGLVLRKYNPTTHTYSMVAGSSITSVTIGGRQATKVEYQVTDGSALDTDGTANGVIVDPVGLAQVASASAPAKLTNTGVEILAVNGASAGVIATAVAVRRRHSVAALYRKQ